MHFLFAFCFCGREVHLPSLEVVFSPRLLILVLTWGAQSFLPSCCHCCPRPCSGREPQVMKVEWTGWGGEVHCFLCILVKKFPFCFGLRELFSIMEGFRTAHREKQLFQIALGGFGPGPDSLCFSEQSLPLLWCSVSLSAE